MKALELKELVDILQKCLRDSQMAGTCEPCVLFKIVDKGYWEIHSVEGSPEGAVICVDDYKKTPWEADGTVETWLHPTKTREESLKIENEAEAKKKWESLSGYERRTICDIMWNR